MILYQYKNIEVNNLVISKHKNNDFKRVDRYFVKKANIECLIEINKNGIISKKCRDKN